MAKTEKIAFILEQVRLCLAKQDYMRAQILARKISPKAFVIRTGEGKGEIGIEGTAIEDAEDGVPRWGGAVGTGRGVDCAAPRWPDSGPLRALNAAAAWRSERSPPPFFPSLPELKVKYYGLMIQYHMHSNNYLEVCRAYRWVGKGGAVRTERAAPSAVSSLQACVVAWHSQRPQRPGGWGSASPLLLQVSCEQRPAHASRNPSRPACFRSLYESEGITEHADTWTPVRATPCLRRCPHRWPSSSLAQAVPGLQQIQALNPTCAYPTPSTHSPYTPQPQKNQVLKKICWFAVLTPTYSTAEGSSSDIATLIAATAADKRLADALPLYKQLLDTFQTSGAGLGRPPTRAL
jgi:hypothetical protein